MSCLIYHNPRCSKSRQALALLQTHGVAPEVRNYLENPLSAAELHALVRAFGNEFRALLRRDEPEFAALGLDPDTLTAAQLVAAIAAHPRLLQRPIVIAGGRAVIGRPPESVLAVL
ncbi:arsenate reductase (glutaredoxin) [Tahibacter amnicola]|uniref:Arsenate reductase n=1 Tax=Tahibacter amnicola TaxID=2976241 RepID=A0ABY6BIZ8_9GAMM|nr:arsenate reductase (glutaredoxin) [Tahibacter amnicola]UXI69998.1 arsenate reductase (glutaredoxin) [Tahibacter amnicola]